ncbi:28S ribosomal protein S28, mitochondrial [Orussus abietinus]|uniref:28S ribosomal protein S28, mitochondrial n=1 Tax=Orussus abietinus TaxID=222816 RepID=UPI0006253002|nr:28S ribosomal protein S28, mitochondrial [Orussus abietinus]
MQRCQRLLFQLRGTYGIGKPRSAFCRFSTTDSTDPPSANETEKLQVEKQSNVSENEEIVKLSGFARAFEKYTKEEEKEPVKEESFASMLRHSTFIDLGDPEGKIAIGKIYHVVEDDLYIDFGWKFPCVCSRPANSGHLYVRGTTVKLRIKDLELSTRFLGSPKDLTILEADCSLIGVVSSPVSKYSEQGKGISSHKASTYRMTT